MWSLHACHILNTSRNWCHETGGLASTVCDLSILFGVTMFAVAGTYTVQLAGAGEGTGAGQAGYVSAPWGSSWQTRNIRTDLGRQCQRGGWGGGVWKGPAVKEPPCSRPASQNSLFTTNLQTREKPGFWKDSSMRPSVIASAQLASILEVKHL